MLIISKKVLQKSRSIFQDPKSPFQTSTILNKFIIVLLICALFLTFAPFKTISASNTGAIKLFNYTTNQTETYSNAALNYICNGNVLDLTKTPAILSDNGVALCSYSALFQKELGLTCNYDSVTGTVTITGNKMSIKMTIGSKKAYVNSKAVSISAAPVKLKFIDSNTTGVLVPTRFICETLGYSYLWNSTNSTVSITTPLHIEYDDTNIIYTSIRANVYADNKKVQLSSLPAIKIENTIVGQAKKIFASSGLGVTYLFNKEKNTVSLNKGDITIIYTLGSKIAYINDIAYDCGTAPKLITNTDLQSSAVYIPVKFTATALGYDYIWDYKTNSCSIETTTNTGNAATIISEGSHISQISDTQILIPLPDGVSLEDITIDDRYHSNKIAICFNKNYSSFYKTNKIDSNHQAITDIIVSNNSDKCTEIIFTTSSIQGYRAEDSSEGLILTIDNPASIYDNIIVLDAGHGGKDPGAPHATSDGVMRYEKNINLSILYTYIKDLFEDSNVKVYYTRTNDTFVELEDRASFPDAVEADLFISLHCNAVLSGTSVHGTGAYYCLGNKYETSGGITNKIMADAFAKSVSTALDTQNRGSVAATFLVIRETHVPSILIETGFMTNPTELSKLVDSNVQKKIAQSIYNTVVALFDKYPNAR